MTQRDEKGRLVKGAVLNPGGRTKKNKDLEELIQQRLCVAGTNKAVEKLIDIADDDDDKDRLRAIELLLAYGFGKPTQRREVSGPDGGPVQTKIVKIPDNGRDP